MIYKKNDTKKVGQSKCKSKGKSKGKCEGKYKRSLKSTSVDDLMMLLRDASEGLARSRTMQRQTHIHKLSDIMDKIPVPDKNYSFDIIDKITDNKKTKKHNKNKNTMNDMQPMKKSFSSFYKMENSMIYNNKHGERYIGVETKTNSKDPFIHITKINSSKKGKNKINKINIPKSNTIIHTNNL